MSAVAIHPAAALFPMLSEDALASLVADIKTHGLRQPIVLFQGQVLDGRNRLLACERAGVAPRFVEHDASDPWRAVWSLNAERRQIEDRMRLTLIAEQMLAGSDEWEGQEKAKREEKRLACSEAGRAGGRGNEKGSPHVRRTLSEQPTREARLDAQRELRKLREERKAEMLEKYGTEGAGDLSGCTPEGWDHEADAWLDGDELVSNDELEAESFADSAAAAVASGDKVRLALIAQNMLAKSDAWPVGESRPMRPAPARDHRAEAERKASTRLASVAGVSRATVERALSLKAKSPEAAAKVLAGEVQGSKALAAVKQAEAREAVAEQARVAPLQAVIRRQDALDFLRALEPHSVDLLLTDPPYMTEFEEADFAPFVESWLLLALSRVKPTGRAYICTGAYSRELLVYLQAVAAQTEMVMGNLLVWTYRNTIGPCPRQDYKANWQAIFHLRGAQAPALNCPVMVEQFSVQDISAPDGRQGDRYHAWQKPSELGDRLVRHSTEEGAFVVDPFACTGTFLLSAAKLGRRSLGCDRDPEALKIAVSRGCRLEE